MLALPKQHHFETLFQWEPDVTSKKLEIGIFFIVLDFPDKLRSLTISEISIHFGFKWNISSAYAIFNFHLNKVETGLFVTVLI